MEAALDPLTAIDVGHPFQLNRRADLEIGRIRDAFLSARGASLTDASALRDFHDAIAGSGGLPIALAERAAMAAV